jgi:hypothetical protein
MPNNPAISDMHVFPLEHKDGRLTLLRNDQHLLRRFGQLDLLDLAPKQSSQLPLRAEADQFVFPITGKLDLTLVDTRASSPTKGAQVKVVLDAEDPQGVLIPFGVAATLSASNQARLVLLSTHSETHAHDRLPSSDDLAQLIRVQ